MKKITAFITALLTLVNVCSCSTSSESKKHPQNLTAEKLTNAAYKREKANVPEEMTSLFLMKRYKDGYLLAGSTNDVSPAFFIADSTMTEFMPFEIPELSTGISYNLDTADDGSIVVLSNEADYGGLPEPDTESEDYDAQLYAENTTYSLFISKYSPEGELISRNELTEMYDTVSPENVSIEGVYTCNGDSCVVTIRSTHYTIGTDGSFYGELRTDSAEKELSAVGENNSGELICAVSTSEEKLKICTIDAKSASINESDIAYNFSDYIRGDLLAGTGDYTAYVCSRTAIYGIRSEDNSIEAVFDIQAAGINANTLQSVFFCDNGSLLVPEIDYMSAKIYRYIPCDPSELENIPTVTIGTNGPGYGQGGVPFLDMVTLINDSQSDYIVELKDYSAENADSPLDGMAQDILSGEAPDIIITDGLEYMRLDEKGAFVDLYDFMAEDDELNRDMFNQNILSLAEIDGHIYTLPTCFTIDTVVGKTKYFEGMESWSIDDYLDYLENSPQTDSEYFTREDASKYLSITDFIDMTNGTCTFDSEEYIRYLEFTARFQSIHDMPWLWDSEDVSDEETNIRYTEQQLAYRNDKAFLAQDSICTFLSYFFTKHGTFGGEDITLVGYSTSDGTGTRANLYSRLAITETSDNKEAAWNVIKQFFSDEYYDNCFYFPILQSKLEEQANESLEPVEYDDTDYNGHYYHINLGSAVTDENNIKIGLPSQEDIDFTMNLINTVSSVENRWSEDIYTIVSEETKRFYAGECTAEQCAKVIQNRVSIYLSEKQ